MPNCDFYAMGSDHRRIVGFLLSSDECDVFELSSKSGQQTNCFRTFADFEAAYGFQDWSVIPVTMHLQLHVRDAGGIVNHRRIHLSNAPSPEAAFRFKSEGWGLIQLYLEAPRSGWLRASHTNHNSRSRAETWSDPISEMGSPEAWDWTKITTFSRRLNAFIRKEGVAKRGSRVILAQAHAQQRDGLSLG